MNNCLYYTVSYVSPGQDTSLLEAHLKSFISCTSYEIYTVLTNHEIGYTHPRINHVRIDFLIPDMNDRKSSKCRIERFVNIDHYSGIFQFDWDIIFQHDITPLLEACQQSRRVIMSIQGSNTSIDFVRCKNPMRYCTSIFFFPYEKYFVFREWVNKLTATTQEEVELCKLFRDKYPGEPLILPSYNWYNGADDAMLKLHFVHFGLERKKLMVDYYERTCLLSL